MKWFPKTLVSWNEPMLFDARIRSRQGWILRGVLALVICIVMIVAFSFDIRGGKRKLSIPAAVGFSILIGVFVTSLLDAPGLNKEVSIDENGISRFGNAGTVTSHGHWKIKNIVRVRLLCPEEFGRTFGLMELQTTGGLVWIGVPRKIPTARIAKVLSRLNVEVELAGWDPNDDSASTAVRVVAKPTEMARIETFGEHEAGQIVTPGRLYTAMAIEAVPLLLTLVAFIGMTAYFIYKFFVEHSPWQLRDLGVVIGGMVLMFSGFWLTARFGSVLPSRYMRRAARDVISRRTDRVVEPDDPNAYYVNIVPRSNWGKLMLTQVADSGFLKIDAAARCVLFEGDRQRWRIPAASLVSVDVESYVPVGKVDPETATPDPDKHEERYFLTVLQARVGERDWEAPISKAQVEWYARTNRRRETSALNVRDEIRDLLPSGWAPADSNEPTRVTFGPIETT